MRSKKWSVVCLVMMFFRGGAGMGGHPAAIRDKRNVTLADYIRSCGEMKDGVMHLHLYMGRAGNRLSQIVNTLEMAVAGGAKAMQLPKTPEWNDEVFAFGDGLIPIDDRVAVNCSKFEAEKGLYDCSYKYNSWCVTSTQVRRALYLKYLVPRLSAGFRGRCGPDPPTEKDLVVHLRDGDVALSTTSGEHAQPPCSYFTYVAGLGQFERIFLVHSGQHPVSKCVQFLVRAFGDRVLSLPTSHAQSACTLIYATNLAVTASSYSTTLGLMNSAVKNFYVVDSLLANSAFGSPGYRRMSKDYSLNLPDLCRAFAYPHVNVVKVEVIRDDTTQFFFKSTDSYFLDFPAAALRHTDCHALASWGAL